MILLFDIPFQSGDFYYSTSISNNYVAIFISLLALFISYINVRYQKISLIQKQLANKAKDCNDNIDPITQGLIITNQNKSKVVSAIITAYSLVERQTKNWLFFPFGYGKQSLIDQFYLQLHTSIVDYIKNYSKSENSEIVDGQVEFHIGLQSEYCHKIFAKSIISYRNATPDEIEEKLRQYIEQKKTEKKV